MTEDELAVKHVFACPHCKKDVIEEVRVGVRLTQTLYYGVCLFCYQPFTSQRGTKKYCRDTCRVNAYQRRVARKAETTA